MLRIVFRVKDESYGVPAGRVVEVIPRVLLRPVAASPPGIAGLFVYRGTVTPVVDLSLLIAGEPCPDRLSSRIIVLALRSRATNGRRLVGLLAEGVTAITMESGDVQASLLIPGARYLGDVARMGDRLVQLIEPEALIPDELYPVLLLESPAGEDPESTRRPVSS